MNRPGFVRHLLLLWELRVALSVNRNRRRSLLWFGPLLASIAPALPLAGGAFLLLSAEGIVASPIHARLAFHLIAFVSMALWIAWPILSAGVDDYSEVSRYTAFPISRLRLLVASTTAGLLEPIGLVIFAPVLGATAAVVVSHPPAGLLEAALVLPLLASYLALAACWSRAALHLVLNILRSHRGAEAIGGGFVAVVVVTSLMPPVDFPWGRMLSSGLGAIQASFVEEAAIGLSRIPTGYLGEGLTDLSAGRTGRAALRLVWLAGIAGAGLHIALRLLDRFSRSSTGSGPSRRAPVHDPVIRSRTRFGVLVAREALDLWRNPRARILVAVPFLMAVLIRLINGRALFREFLGPTSDAWLLGGLCLYTVVVFSSAFVQNMFAYDGHGLAVLLSSPVPMADVVRAKNLTHATAAILLSLVVGLFYRVYFLAGSGPDLLAAFAGVLALTPVLLTVGNLVSIRFPVRFDTTLRRRDEQPRAAMVTGMAAAGLGVVPFTLALRQAAGQPVGGPTVARILAAAVVAWAVYAAVLPASCRLAHAHRERILRAVQRK